MLRSKLALYIHWPFCLSKCPYCDFNSHVASNINYIAWMAAYEKELDYFADYLNNCHITSIFFGGGTPSLMPPFIIDGIIQKIASLGYVDELTEISLEANPTSFEIQKFKEFKQSGVNRVSIGVQSLIDLDLKKLGREHDSALAKNAVEMASKIFSRFSFDLIYARSNQKLEDWQRELEQAVQIAGGHISLYQLTIEKGTLFYKLHKEGSLTIPENDLAADMYEWTTSYLSSKGYNRYEISNYAAPLHECQHNMTYWRYNEYLGIGPGAHSRITINNKLQALMMWHKPAKWLEEVAQKGAGIQTMYSLSTTEKIEELFMMGLRLQEGISQNKLVKLTGYNIEQVIDHEYLHQYQKAGLVELTKDNLRLTDKGLMLHGFLVPRLLNLSNFS